MIRVAIIRHGKAEQDADSGLDEDRPLRPKGKRQADHLARYFAALDPQFQPGVVVHSGLVRARETAEPIARAVSLSMRQAEGLRPEDPPSAVVDLVQALTKSSPRHGAPIAIIGHNPQLGAVVAILTSGITGHDTLLRTGEAFILDVNLNQPIGSARLIERVRMPSEETASNNAR